MKKALFLDRDGVINKDIGYLYRKEDVIFIENIFRIVKYFQNKGFLIIVITNQAGIARKYYTEDDFFILTKWFKEKFLEKGIEIDKTYYCPHHPEFTGNCNCRKPKPGMIINAINEFNIDEKKSYLIGNKYSDVEAGINAGIKYNFLFDSKAYFNSLNKGKYVAISELSEIVIFHKYKTKGINE